MLLPALRPRAGAARCPYCREALGDGGAACPGCRVAQHADCLREAGRCPTLGCVGVPRPAPARGACARCGEPAAHGAGRLLLRCTRVSCRAWHHVDCVATATCTVCGDALAPDVPAARVIAWLVVALVATSALVMLYGPLLLLALPALVGVCSGVVTARHRPRPRGKAHPEKA